MGLKHFEALDKQRILASQLVAGLKNDCGAVSVEFRSQREFFSLWNLAGWQKSIDNSNSEPLTRRLSGRAPWDKERHREEGHFILKLCKHLARHVASCNVMPLMQDRPNKMPGHVFVLYD